MPQITRIVRIPPITPITRITAIAANQCTVEAVGKRTRIRIGIAVEMIAGIAVEAVVTAIATVAGDRVGTNRADQTIPITLIAPITPTIPIIRALDRIRANERRNAIVRGTADINTISIPIAVRSGMQTIAAHQIAAIYPIRGAGIPMSTFPLSTVTITAVDGTMCLIQTPIHDLTVNTLNTLNTLSAVNAVNTIPTVNIIHTVSIAMECRCTLYTQCAADAVDEVHKAIRARIHGIMVQINPLCASTMSTIKTTFHRMNVYITEREMRRMETTTN